MDIDTDHKKFHASVPVKPMVSRRLRQADEPWTTGNSRPKQKIPPEEVDNHQIKWTKILYKLSQPHGNNSSVYSYSRHGTTMPLAIMDVYNYRASAKFYSIS